MSGKRKGEHVGSLTSETSEGIENIFEGKINIL